MGCAREAGPRRPRDGLSREGTRRERSEGATSPRRTTLTVRLADLPTRREGIKNETH